MSYLEISEKLYQEMAMYYDQYHGLTQDLLHPSSSQGQNNLMDTLQQARQNWMNSLQAFREHLHYLKK